MLWDLAVNATQTSTQNPQLNPLQLYLTGQLWQLDFIMFLPFGWIIWTKFLRNGFLLHFVIEEGESLREIQSKWFVPLDKEGQHLNLRLGGRGVKRGTKFTVFIDGRKVLFTDRFNKRHLVYPVNNTFAFHPFADEIILPTITKDILIQVPSKMKEGIVGFITRSKYQDLDNAEKIDIEKTELNHISPVRIKLVETVRFDAIKLFKYFFGEAMIARVEASRNLKKADKWPYILGALMGALAVFAIINSAPQTFGLEHVIPSATTTVTTTTTTSSTSTFSQFISGATTTH